MVATLARNLRMICKGARKRWVILVSSFVDLPRPGAVVRAPAKRLIAAKTSEASGFAATTITVAQSCTILISGGYEGGREEGSGVKESYV